MVNPRDKGQRGEREAYHMLNGLVVQVLKELGRPESEITKAASAIQRNQNQSAVGGNDLTNTFGLSIEIKRQENLQVPAWWRQTIAAAERNGEVPVLLYRQNNKAWRCRTLMELDCPVGNGKMVPAEIDFETFQMWFKDWVRVKLRQGEPVRS
jgi:hypothetical protein